MGKNSLTPLVSVVVCTYNRADLLRTCLESLVAQTADKSLYEVIVVNNNFSDATIEAAAKFVKSQPNFRMVTETKQGLSHARNRGWQESTGEYVAYIDDDAQASPDWCERILKAFSNVKPAPVAVGGKILPWYESSPPVWFSDELETRTWGDEAGFLKPPGDAYGFSGSNMTFPRSIFDKLGGFSTGFGMVGGKLRMGEDSEFFFRLYKNGKDKFWYDPEIQVKHFTPTTHFFLSYRLKRAYVTGTSYAYLKNSWSNYSSWIKSLLGIPHIILKEIINALSASSYDRSKLVKSSQNIAHQTGCFIEMTRRLIRC
ncbi:MAG: glycosyltransferase family 2 protein [Deltaproteobacteria bacterium]|nr:MAG: glycosyltransferase family 2 protein [Deltaproteobacteria bacterium]